MMKDFFSASTCRGLPTTGFTHHPDNRAEELVSGLIDWIVKAVVSRISPRAIVLAGSFGRGEGSVEFNHDQPRVISDFEVAVVTWNLFKRNKIIRLSNALSKELGVDVSLFWATPGRIKHNRMKNLAFGKSKPTRFMYDFKAGSIVLYGGLNLRKDRLSPEDLSAWEGLRLILNRLAEFLFQIDREGFQRWVSGQDLGELLPIPKSLLSAMNGLLIASGRFRPSLQDRLETFLDQPPFHIDLNGLSDELKNAVDHRIREVTWQGIPWSIYRRFVLDSIRILVKETFDLQFEDMASFPEAFRPTKESQEIVTQYEPGWLPIGPLSFEKTIQRFKLKRAGLGSEIQKFKNSECLPSLVIHSMIPGMVLLEQDGRFDGILDGYRKSGFNVDDILEQSGDEWQRWDAVRLFLMPLWKAIC